MNAEIGDIVEKDRNITLRPEKIRFTEKYINMTDTRFGRYKIPYNELVLAEIKTRDKESGLYYEPEVTDITEKMEGDLYLCDTKNCRFRIQTEKAGRAAGSMLSELSMRAPYILIGKQSWVDLDDEEAFAEVSSMVKLMQGCRG